jgi:hypothetical protein
MVFVVATRRKKGLSIMSTFQLGLSTEDMRTMCLHEGALDTVGTLRDIIDSYSGDGAFIEHIRQSKIDRPQCFNAVAADTSGDHAAFYSLTAQAAHVREHGEAATRALLADAGLKLGQLLKEQAKDSADTIKGANNPYSDSFKGTPAEREARIASLIKSGGAKLAASLAASAGKTLTNQPLFPVGAERVRR